MGIKFEGRKMKVRISALACLSVLAAAAWPLAAMAADNGPREWQTDLPAAATPIMESLRHFHTLLLVIITGIVLLVLSLLIWVMYRYRESANPVSSKTSHNTMIEVIWTIVPVLILIVIAIPSFRLLFDQYEFPKPDVIVKVTGKQWNWSYEYPQDKISFDSFMVDAKDLKPGQIRTLSVDNEMVVPVNKVVQVLIAAADVTHQWTVQGFGVRADAIPGRVNRTWFKATETGTFYGQCSQLCGNGHPYMPIVVRVVNEEEYKNWVANKQKTAAIQGNQLASAQ
jgi:cytochrome c oxidase subunit 2